jgi:WD40 repeat protein
MFKGSQNELIIEKKFSKWIIIITNDIDLINIIIKNKKGNLIYQNNFKQNYLKKFKLFSTINSIKEIKDFFSIMINNKNIKIIKKKYSLILTLSNENTKIEFNLIRINQKIRKIKEIPAHNNFIISTKIFPNSGNIVSISYDNSIKIWNDNLELLQKIENVNNDNSGISNISIKDENNFTTYSNNNDIKYWTKENNKFIELKQINERNYFNYLKSKEYIIFTELNNIIISEEIENKIQDITVLTHSDIIYSIGKKLNLLISSGIDGTKIWNINNFECLFYIKEAICYDEDAIKFIDDDRLIVGGGEDNIISIISINQKKIIKFINNKFQCWTINIIKEKEIFLTGGKSNNIKVYRSDNYNCIQIIKNAHKDHINGILLLNNDRILSYSDDKKICIWKFIK